MQIGKKIKELRKSQNMTLVELSQKSGVQVANNVYSICGSLVRSGMNK